ncbi:RodZ domain-containing protein [Nonomuraea sp. NPDC000554]|uniref:helix-turn-helix domain-containing protein n=1 Tax=Nonomuraea sp. NPDC000554 TaxID=3154259 RepID=UPI00332F72AB
MPEQSIGAMLAEARQKAGMTVAQLSEITRIREAIIYAIEREDYTQCEDDFYRRGHVKALAKAVGLDPEATVHQYDQEHGGGPPPIRAAAVFQADRKIRLRERRGPNWTLALGVALAIVVVFGVVRVMGGPDEVQTADTKPIPGQKVPPAPVSKPKVAKPKAPAGVLVLKVKAKRTSYLDIQDSEGRKLFSGMLQAGQTSTWRSTSAVNMLIGDASAVSLQVNGKNVGKLGDRGETVRRSFKPSAPHPG